MSVERVRGGKNRPSKARLSQFARSVNTDVQKGITYTAPGVHAGKLVPDHANDVRVVEARSRFECYDVEERYDAETDEVLELPVIDRSLTKRLHLRLYKSAEFDVITVKTRQLDKKDGRKERMIETTDQRYIKTMDNSTLLRRERPYEHSYKALPRVTSKSKRVTYDPDTEFRNRPRDRKPTGVFANPDDIL